jgi:hypothetical protein
MSAQEIIEEIKALPLAERAKVASFILSEDASLVPDSFAAGMKAAAENRFIDMETALHETPPPHLQ